MPAVTTAALMAVAGVIADSLFSRCIPALVEGTERDPRLADFHHRYSATRRAELAAVIAAGVEAGAFDRDIDPGETAVALLGVLFYRRLMTADPFRPEEAPALVDRLLPPITRGAPPGRRAPSPAG